MRIIMICLIMYVVMALNYGILVWAEESFYCYSDQEATTGFFPENSVRDIAKGKGIKMKLKHVPLKKDSFGGGFQIQLGIDVAEVKDEVTKIINKYKVSSRNKNQIILVREKEVGVETITIDKSNHSFIFTDMVIHDLYHRTVVWVGECN